MSTFKPADRPEGEDLALQTRRLLPFLALFVRLSLGLSLLNAGLSGVFATNGPRNGPFGFPAPGQVPGLMGMPGTESLATVLPYAEMAVGLGLIFGVFTTFIALLGCALTLVAPLVMSVTLATQVGINPGMNRFFGGMEFLTLMQGQSTLTYVALVLLSPPAINRISVDTLIFQRRAVAPPPAAPPGGAEAGVTVEVRD